MTPTPWNQVTRAACVIDTAMSHSRARLPRDEQGQVLDGARPEPVITVVTRTLTGLRAELVGEPGDEAQALKRLLDALLVALERLGNKRGQGRRR